VNSFDDNAYIATTVVVHVNASCGITLLFVLYALSACAHIVPLALSLLLLLQSECCCIALVCSLYKQQLCFWLLGSNVGSYGGCKY
jgi:hypothetical protein